MHPPDGLAGIESYFLRSAGGIGGLDRRHGCKRSAPCLGYGSGGVGFVNGCFTGVQSL